MAGGSAEYESAADYGEIERLGRRSRGLPPFASGRLHTDIPLLPVLRLLWRVEVDHPTFVYIGEANARGARLLP